MLVCDRFWGTERAKCDFNTSLTPSPEIYLEGRGRRRGRVVAVFTVEEEGGEDRVFLIVLSKRIHIDCIL